MWSFVSRLEKIFINSTKYLDYFFETKGFTSNSSAGKTSDYALRTAHSIRGAGRSPAIIIHGIMPRSGTVYVGELLRLHPDLYAYPYQLWEFPALQLVQDIQKLQKKFLLNYKANIGKLGDDDFLALFGAALIAFLCEPVPANRRPLIKIPSVQFLSHFTTMFPFESLLVLTRDGRDVVHSTLRTWPYLNFIQVCLRWHRSAQAILGIAKQHNDDDSKGFLIAKYEDALLDPVQFVKVVCNRFCLDENSYPFERIDMIRVIGSSKLEDKNKVTWRHLKKPENFRPIEYWRRWSYLKRLIFKMIAGQSLIELGYCKDLNW
jgi:protein-tyrosine sulfotransferase